METKKEGLQVHVGRRFSFLVEPSFAQLMFKRKIEALIRVFRLLKGFAPQAPAILLDESLDNDAYVILFQGFKVSGGKVPHGHWAVVGEPESLAALDGEELYESFTGAPCKWVPLKGGPPRHEGCLSFSGSELIALDIYQALEGCAPLLVEKAHLPIWMEHPACLALRADLGELPDEEYFLALFQKLLLMEVPPLSAPAVFAAIGECRQPERGNPALVAEGVRKKMYREILKKSHSRRSPSVPLALREELLAPLASLVKSMEKEHSLFADKRVQPFLLALGEMLYEPITRRARPLLLCPPGMRSLVEVLVKGVFPEATVLASGEWEKPGRDDRHSDLEAFKWSKARLSLFLKHRLSGHHGYKVAPLWPGYFWLAAARGLFSQAEGREKEAMGYFEEARGENDGFFLSHHLLGDCYLSRGAQDKVLRSFGKARECSDFYPDMLLEWGKEIFSGGDAYRAHHVYDAILAIDRGNTGALASLGELFMENGRMPRAVKILKEALSRSPYDIRPRRVLGELFLSRGDYDSAEECFKEALSLDAGDAWSRFGLGMVCYHRGKWREAEWEFLRALQGSPSLPVISFRLGWLYFESGDFERAEQRLLRALEQAPGNGEFMMALGILNFEWKRYDKAARYLREASTLEPGNSKTRELLARSLIKCGSLDEALEEYDKLMFIAPGEGRYAHGKAVLLQEMGRGDEAHGLLEEAVRKSPQWAPAYGSLGWSWCEKSEMRRAERFFLQGLSIEGGEPLCLYGIGSLRYFQDRIDEAERFLKACLKSAPHSDGALFLLGKCSRRRGQTRKALSFMEKALALKPGNVSYRMEAAALLREEGSHREALALIEEGLVIFPDERNLLLSAAQVCRKLGLGAEGEKLLHRGLELFPGECDFYVELMLLYEEEGNFRRLSRLDEKIREHISGTWTGRALHAFVLMAGGECREALALSLGLLAGAGEDTRRTLLHSYLAALSYLLKDFPGSWHYVKKAEEERGEEILRDSFVGELYEIMGKGHLFEKRCLKYLDGHYCDTKVMKSLGEYYLMKGEWEKASPLLRKVYRLEPRLSRIHHLAGELFLRHGKYRKAESVFQAAIKAFPFSPDHYMSLGQLYYDMGRLEEGLIAVTRAVELAPPAVASFYRFCLAVHRQAAEEAVERYGSLNDAMRESTQALQYLASSLMEMERYEEALEAMERGKLGLVDRYLKGEWYYARALIYWLRGSLKEARKSLRKAQALSLGVGNALLSRGFLLYLEGASYEAEEAVKQVVNSRPAFVEAYFLLGLIAQQAGDKRKASRWYGKAIQIAPGNRRFCRSLESISPRVRRHEKEGVKCAP
ncbi:MAG: tetratricopeptide repeat protein [Candidatus Eremiobacteraeota bacterium]|nr:tetratricopeptide repeat protein [Candidatus Eremiobacteraeota bacterium]